MTEPRRRPTVDSPLGELIAGRIDQAEYRRRIGRHPRRNAVMPDRAGLELRVDPEPVHPVIRCRRCGDSLAFGRIGRCAGCAGREGSAVGCLPAILFVIAAVIVAVIVAVLVVAALVATPRSAPESTALLDVSQGASAPGPTGAPHVVSPMTGSSETPPASAVAGDGGGAPRYRGLATWFCLSGSSACTTGYDQADLVAAIDTDLGFVKGDRIRVRFGDRSVVVTITDVCGCPGDRLVDLTSGAFRELANLDLGVIPVTVELAGPDATLPATEATR